MTLLEVATQLRQLADAADANPRQFTLTSRRSRAGSVLGGLGSRDRSLLVSAGLGELASFIATPGEDALACEERWVNVVGCMDAARSLFPGIPPKPKHPPIPWTDVQESAVFSAECRCIAHTLHTAWAPPPADDLRLYAEAGLPLARGRVPLVLEPEPANPSAIDRLNYCLTLCLETYSAWAGALGGDAAYWQAPDAGELFNAGAMLNLLPFRLCTAREMAIESAPAGSRENVRAKLDPMVNAALALVETLRVNGSTRSLDEVLDMETRVFREGPWLGPLRRLFAASKEVIPLIVAARSKWIPAHRHAEEKPADLRTPKWFNDATSGGLYPDLLKRARRERRLTGYQAGHGRAFHFSIADVLALYPDFRRVIEDYMKAAKE